MTGERSDWSCPSCDSSDVFRVGGDMFKCESCGLETSEAREASVSRDGDGERLGVALFLSSSQLDALGVDTDAQEVRYWVDGNGLHVEGVAHQ